MVRKRAKATLFRGIFALTLLFSSFPSALLSQVSNHLQSRYLSALKLLGEEEYEKAIFEFQKIIQGNPDFSKAYRSLVETYLFRDELDTAQDYFENLLKENSNNPYANYALARIDFARKEYDRAIEKLKKTIALDPKFADAYSHRGGLPEVYKAKHNLDSAIRYFRELIQADPSNPCAYYGLARSHIRKYEWQKALNLLAKAIELDPEFTLAYHSMIYIYSRTSKNNKVLERSEQLLEIAEKKDDFEMTSYATMMMGNYYFLQGDYLKALHYFNKALKSAKEIGAKRIEGNRLNNMAIVYAMSGNYSKALQYFKEALHLKRKTGAKSSEVRTLANIGNVYKDQGNYQEALKYYNQALDSAQKNQYKRQELITLANMAEIYQKRGDYNQATAYQNNALRIAKELEDKWWEGFILRNLGSLNEDLGNHSKAIQYLLQALKIGFEIQAVQIIWESQAGLGSSYEKQGDLQQAITHYARAIAVYDSVRERLDIESLGNNFLEDKYEAYPSIVQLLAQNGKPKEAFTYAEKYKAKILLDILSQRQDLLSGLLSDTLKAQLQQITSQREAAHKALSLELSKTAKDKDKILSLDQRITDLELKKAVIIEDLKKKNKAYYQLTAPEILQPDQIQRRFLRNEQALVEYILGPKQMSIFVVTPDTLIYSQVAVSRERLRTMLADLSPIFQLQKTALEKNPESFFHSQLADFSITPTYALYEVLVKPIETWLQGTKDLIIVPDDILFYLPFEMLIFDTTGTETPYDFEKAKFLLEKFDISYTSSASLLDPNLQRVRKPKKGLLAIGNPDFGLQTTEPGQGELLVSTEPNVSNIFRGDNLAALPNSESEVKAIDKVLSGSENTILIGNQATEENFKAKSEDYRILHLATHFLTNDDQPLYSKMVLAQKNKTNEDGYIQTYEVFNMCLNADLVVLSACNTGLGKLRKGAGIIGISRAFLFAGVPSLVVSLWSVDDESTSIIMENFYQYLKEGLNKKQALRLAKIDYLKSSQSQGKDPFYWAPFILIGDWSPIDLPSHPTLSMRTVAIMVILLVLTATFIIKTRLRFLKPQ
jgi:CHAT domain-containing protein/Tfp pilus assembly protein PilF